MTDEDDALSAEDTEESWLLRTRLLPYRLKLALMNMKVSWASLRLILAEIKTLYYDLRIQLLRSREKRLLKQYPFYTKFSMLLYFSICTFVGWLILTGPSRQVFALFWAFFFGLMLRRYPYAGTLVGAIFGAVYLGIHYIWR
jgi:hypothetical protein